MKAYAVLLFCARDKITLKQRVSDTFPEKSYIRKIYEDINFYYQMAMGDGRGCTFAFNIDEFCRNFKHFPVQTDSALKILTRAGYLEYTDEQDNASRIMFTITKEELYRIREQSEDTEKLIRILLRSYTGLFTDYAYISEDNLSTRSGLSKQQIYETLLSLSRQHILHYIPAKKTPYIIYTRERQETERVYLSKEVYEDRKESYVQRINAMIEYAESENRCRSRMLLRYFGEKNEHNCGQCDVCLQQHQSGLKSGEFESISQQLQALLKENPLSLQEIKDKMQVPENHLMKVVSYLVSEEIIRQENGYLEF